MDVFESLLRKPGGRLQQDKYECVPILSLDDPFDDTPEFRDKLHKVNADIDDFCAGLKRINRWIRQIAEVGREYSRLINGLGDEMLNFRVRPQAEDEDPKLQQSMMRFGGALKSVSEGNEAFIMDIETYTYKPVDYFLKHDYEECKIAKKTYERSRDIFNSIIERNYANPQKKEKTRQESGELKALMMQATFDYVRKMIDIEKRKQFEFIEYYSKVIDGYHVHHEKIIKDINGLDEFKKEVKEYCDAEKQSWSEYSASAAMKRRSQMSRPKVSQGTLKKAAKQGYLFKKSRNMSMKEWNRRFFVIRDGHLIYFRNLKEPVSRGSVNLLLSTVKEANYPEHPNCFEVISNETTYCLMAETEEDMRDWIQAIQTTIGNLLGALHISDHGSAGVRGEDPLSIVRDSSPSNSKCADCGAADPDWVSINIGCVICIECSGIHRSLGVHISKVRSLTLDRFDKDILNYLKSIGNQLVNDTWTPNIDPFLTPTSISDRATKEDFIKTKYVLKKFITSNKPETSQEDINLQLYESISKGDFVQSYKLLAHGAAIDAVLSDHHNRSLVHAAVICSSLTCTDLLLMNDARTDTYDCDGLAPIHHIVLQNDTDMLRLCLRRGIQYNLPVTDGIHKGKTVLDLVPTNLFQCLRLLGAAFAGTDIDAAFEYDDQVFAPDNESQISGPTTLVPPPPLSSSSSPSSSSLPRPIDIRPPADAEDQSSSYSFDSSHSSALSAALAHEQSYSHSHSQPPTPGSATTAILPSIPPHLVSSQSSPSLLAPQSSQQQPSPRTWSLSSPRGITAVIHSARKWTLGGSSTASPNPQRASASPSPLAIAQSHPSADDPSTNPNDNADADSIDDSASVLTEPPVPLPTSASSASKAHAGSAESHQAKEHDARPKSLLSPRLLQRLQNS